MNIFRRIRSIAVIFSVLAGCLKMNGAPLSAEIEDPLSFF